jgi:hypothetical protein
MDHLEALQTQAAEKYVLGELPENLRDAYEEHFFDCTECSKDVKALASFIAASREIFEHQANQKFPTKKELASDRAWFSWLRPAIALPIAALVAVITYQNLVTFPAAKKQTPIVSAQVYESAFRLQGSTRGGPASTVTVQPSRSFALEFDFTPTQSFASYTGRVLDQSGNPVVQFDLSSEQDNKEVHLVIPGGIVQTGNYDLVIAGNTPLTNQDPKSSEVLRIPFVVAPKQ